MPESAKSQESQQTVEESLLLERAEFRERLQKAEEQLQTSFSQNEFLAVKVNEAKQEAAVWKGKYEAIEAFAASRLDVVLDAVAEHIKE
jgi:hypothetical protein